MKYLLCSGVGLLAITSLWTLAAQDQPRQGAVQNDAPAKAPAARDSADKPAQPQQPGAQTEDTAQRSPEEKAALKKIVGLGEAFTNRDAQAFAGLFTTDGEYVDEAGHIYHGRKAIEDDFAAFFKACPHALVELDLHATRPIAPGVVAIDGSTAFCREEGEPTVNGRCSFIVVKKGDDWEIASLREMADHADEGGPAHHDQLAQLEWMVGDWVDEGIGSNVHFNCRWDESGNYLLRDFTVRFAGLKVISGTQRIGYDAATKHLKSWIFDSEGGFAEGYFHRDGDTWVIQMSGVTADGQLASGIFSLTQVDENRMTWSAHNRVVGGEAVPDIETISIVKHPPQPGDVIIQGKVESTKPASNTEQPQAAPARQKNKQ